MFEGADQIIELDVIATGLADLHILLAIQFISVIQETAHVADKCAKQSSAMVDFFDYEINQQNIVRRPLIPPEDFALTILALDGLLDSMDAVSDCLSVIPLVADTRVASLRKSY